MTAPPISEPLAAALEALERRGRRVDGAFPLAGDVSRRAYFRLRLVAGSAILALYPPDLAETCSRYLATTRLLTGAGVRVPEVLDQDCRAGWALLEDLGPRTLYEEREKPWSELGPYFEAAAAAARRIAGLADRAKDEVATLNPPLDRGLLERELGLTRSALFEPLGLAGGPEVAAALSALCARLAAEPPVPCHRDFGARNLMPLGGPGPARVGVLDHQDLRLGPPAYDLASLLNDSLFPPPELEERLLAEASVHRESYYRAAAQRTLKAVGSYAAFAHRGSSRHLPLIAPTLARSLDHLSRAPETEPLTERFAALWRPLAEGRIDLAALGPPLC